METGLRLLMRDGAIQVYFHPRLTTDQYAELMRLVDGAATKAELADVLRSATQRWGIELVIDE